MLGARASMQFTRFDHGNFKNKIYGEAKYIWNIFYDGITLVEGGAFGVY